MHLDWSTLALQTVNVLVLVWLLARYLFRPVTTIIADRRAAADKLLADAAAMRAQAESAAAEVQHRLQSISAEAERTLTEARAQAQTERTKLLQQAADAASHTHDEAVLVIENDRAAMERTLRQRAGELAIAIARRLLQRLPASAATAALLETVTSTIAELPVDERHRLAAGGGAVDVITAEQLDERQQTICRDLFGQAFGAAPKLTFRTDPALIAGVELHTEQMLIRNNWQADLERISNELRQDEQHVAGPEHLA